MPRPVNCRRISQPPCVARFKPCGKPCRELDSVTLTLDEFEAIRLTDFEHMYQAQAAEMMGVSRPTLSRIIESAHAKVASMLVNGMELRIQGGFVTTGESNVCPRCSRLGTGGMECPRCRKTGARQQPENGPAPCGDRGEDQ